MDVSVHVIEVVAIQLLDQLRHLLDSLEVEDVLLVRLVFLTVAREAMRGGDAKVILANKYTNQLL